MSNFAIGNKVPQLRRTSDVNGDSVFGGDHVSCTSQIHEHWTQVGQCGRDGDVEPVRDWRRVSKRTDPKAVTNPVTYVMRGQWDEEHPGQGTPGVLQPTSPHEEAQRETQCWDQCGAVQGRPMGQIHSIFKWQWSSQVEVIQVNDRGQEPSQNDFIEVTFFPQANHNGPGPESNYAMDRIVQQSPEP